MPCVVLGDRQAPEQEQPHPESTKLVHRVDAIESYLKASEQERLALIRNEVDQAKSEALKAREEAQQAEESAKSRASELKEREHQCCEAETRSRQLAQELEEEAAAHARARQEVEEARRAVADRESQCEEPLKELQRLKSHLAEVQQTQDTSRTELEAKFKAANDQCNAYRVRQTLLQQQTDQKTSENAELREELDQKLAEISQLQQRRDLENAALLQDKNLSESRLSDMNGRFQALEIEHRALQEECRQQEQRERLHKCTDNEKVARPVRAKGEEEENRSLKQTVQEQKSLLFDLQSQLHREQAIANLIMPGEYTKMAKKQEGDLARDNAELKLRNFSLETEIKEVWWHNEVLRKHLPRAVWGLVSKELHALPLPVREPAEEAETIP